MLGSPQEQVYDCINITPNVDKVIPQPKSTRPTYFGTTHEV
jgi:hypothetical protein